MSGGLGNYALFSGGPFTIATIIPDVVIEAVGQDALGITGYPCEDGVVRTDHSFKLPTRLEMTAGWSDSSSGSNGSIRQIYQRLLSLQATRQPFTISTSRRQYKNMLLESLTDPISARTFNAMVPRITFRELQISRTRTSSGSTAQPATDPSKQADAANTGAVTDRGTVTGTDVGPQAFAGSFNPGTYNPDGGTLGPQGFGLNTPSADPQIDQIVTSPGSGFSAPALTMPDYTIAPLSPVDVPSGIQQASPDYYNMFGGGP